MDFSRRKKKKTKTKISRLNVCKRSRVQTDKSRAKRCFYLVPQTDWAASDTHMSSCCRGLRGWGTNWNSRPGPPEGPASLRQPAEKWRGKKKQKGWFHWQKAADPSTRCDPKAGPRHKALMMSRVIEHYELKTGTHDCIHSLWTLFGYKNIVKACKHAAINTTDTQFDPLIGLMFLTACFRYWTEVNWC